ncbi:aromatic compound dioxygenase [Paxillus ammoniavirescens]|nr:aromatic compound dioxygenase [Paxillus ammoniavirescens]
MLPYLSVIPAELLSGHFIMMGDLGETKETATASVPNGIPPPSFHLPLPDTPEIITANFLKVLGQTSSNPRLRSIYQLLVQYLHAFVKETKLSTDEWIAAIEFLTRVGQTCTPARNEMSNLSAVLGVTALVGFLNNPVTGGATENSLLGPYFTDDAEDIEVGDSIASEGKGEYMYVEGRVLTTTGEPIPDAIIETWEADHNVCCRTHPDCRGRLRTMKNGSFGYRAVVPRAYPVPSDGPVGELLMSQNRHNMRPIHLHMVFAAPGYHKLVTALYPDHCVYLKSDPVFGVRTSLVVKLEQVDNDEEARKRGFPKGGSFKLLKHDIVLLTEEQWTLVKEQV